MKKQILSIISCFLFLVLCCFNACASSITEPIYVQKYLDSDYGYLSGSNSRYVYTYYYPSARAVKGVSGFELFMERGTAYGFRRDLETGEVTSLGELSTQVFPCKDNIFYYNVSVPDDFTGILLSKRYSVDETSNSVKVFYHKLSSFLSTDLITSILGVGFPVAALFLILWFGIRKLIRVISISFRGRGVKV